MKGNKSSSCRLVLLTNFKKKVQEYLRIEAKALHQIGLTPNHLSILGLISGIISGLNYWLAGTASSKVSETYLLVATFFLLISGFLDVLDGVLARIFEKTTIKGGYLDSIIDRYVDASIFLGLILGNLCDTSWGLLALIGSILTSYSRARSEAASIGMETIGIVERAERLLLIIAASFLTFIWSESIRWVVVILAILTNLTVVQRIYFFFKKAVDMHERVDK